jgi:hypothetical protein
MSPSPSYSGFLSEGFRGSAIQSTSGISTKRVYLLFLFVSAVLFAPFLIQGRVLFGNTDNLWCFYPNIIFGHNNFRAGDFGLWNPAIFTGVDTSSLMHTHMLNPMNWVLLLVPNSLVLQAITTKVLIEISLIGFFTFLVATSLLSEQLSAMACGLAFQLSGFVWFSITNAFTTELLLAFTAYTYVLLTHERRTAFWNYLYLSLCFAVMMFGGDLAYAGAFLVLVPILGFIVASRRPQRYRIRLLGLLTLSGFTALAVAGFRFLSVALNVGETSRLAALSSAPALAAVPGNNGAWIFAGAVPGIWGFIYSDATTILRWLNITGNLQASSLSHFAVLPLLLLFLSISGRLGRAACVASIAAALIASTDTGFVPMFSELAHGIFRFLHPIVFKVSYALLAGAAIIFAFSYFDKHTFTRDWAAIALVPSFLIAAACFAMWMKCIYNVPLQALEPFRPMLEKLLWLFTAGTFFGAIGVALFWRHLPLRWFSNLVVIAYVVGAASESVVYLHRKLFTTSSLTLQSMVYTTVAVFCGALTIFALRRWRAEDGESAAWRGVLPGLLLAVIVVAVPIPAYSGYRAESLIFGGAMLATGRFLAMAILGVELLSFTQRLGWRPVLPFLLVFLFADAILLSRAYENFGTQGFEKPGNMYVSGPLAKDEAQTSRSPNLIQNESLKLTAGTVEKWSLGGVNTQDHDDPSQPGAIVVKGGGGSALFQDVAIPPNTHRIVFGAWVKSDSPKVALALTAWQTEADPTGAPLTHHSGNGQWEWLKVSLESLSGFKTARPHLFVFDSQGEIFGPVLAIGSQADPTSQPNNISPAELAKVSTQDEKPDFAQFRVTNPQSLLGYPQEPVSNIPMLYGYRTYGGSDSILNPELERLLLAFVPDRDVIALFGVRNLITEPRLLDLLGVRYDLASGEVRPNALPRVSVFSSFEVAHGFDAQLSQLKDPAFDYTTAVVLDSIPAGLSPASGLRKRFVPTPYIELSNSHLQVKTNVSQPCVLLFNDSFSPDWHAYRDGRPVPIIRANAHFMAVGLPPGASEIDFRFEPARFYLLFKISIATAFLLVLAVIWKVAQRRLRAAPSRSRVDQS